MRTRYRTLAETTIKTARILFDDGRPKLTDPMYANWLNERLTVRAFLLGQLEAPERDEAHILKLALRELVLTLTVAGLYSDMPVATVFRLIDEVRDALPTDTFIGLVITDDFTANEEEAEEYGISVGTAVLEANGTEIVTHGRKF